jgi:hypothetical protein
MAGRQSCAPATSWLGCRRDHLGGRTAVRCLLRAARELGATQAHRHVRGHGADGSGKVRWRPTGVYFLPFSYLRLASGLQPKGRPSARRKTRVGAYRQDGQRT